MRSSRIAAKRELLHELRRNQNPLAYFSPQKYQQPFFDSLKKNKAVFGGNRSGKTICGADYVLEKCLAKPSQRWRASTWADMSVSVQQTKIYELLPRSQVEYASFNEKRGFTNKIIIFKNGSTLRFKTYDQGRESYQGSDLDGEWDDEEPPESIISEQKARLIDRNGELIRTMTPLNGITYTYDEIVQNEGDDPEVEYWFFDSSMNEHINQDALERIIGSYASKEAEVRKSGHFLNLTTGNAYYSFNEDNIISEYDFDRKRTKNGEFEYLPYRPLEVDCDFNVDIMSWGVAQTHQEKDYTFDEIELLNHANTDLMCQMLKSKYAFHNGGWIFYGDIAGNQRHPEASRTNWSIIREHFPNAKLYYQHIKNIKDRVDATNARLKDSKGNVNAFLTKNCKRKIKDYRQVTWEMLLNKTKAKLLTHASDGSSYKFFWKYPLTGKPIIYQGRD